MKKIAHTYLAAFATAVLLLTAASCSQLQDSLSSEQNAKMLEETGNPTLAEKVWYYNGTANTGADATTGGYLKVDYGQQIKVGNNGISGNFLISYTDRETGNAVTITKSLMGGVEAGESYCLDMTPILKMLGTDTDDTGSSIPKNFKNGEATVAVTLGGMVCNAGSQAGRNVSTLNQNIKIKPLYNTTTVALSTNPAPVGTVFTLPIAGNVTLSNEVSVMVTGDNIPSAATWKVVGLSDDGKGICIVSDTDLTGLLFDATISVFGIIPATDILAYTGVWTANFLPLISTDSIAAENLAEKTYDLSSLVVAQDGTNLKVMVFTNDKLKVYKRAGLTILFDNTSIEADGVLTTTSTWQNSQVIGIASKVTCSDTIEGELSFSMGDSADSWKGYLKSKNSATAELQTNTSISATTISGTNVTVSGGDEDNNWKFVLSSEVLVFTVPLADLGLTAGDTVRVYAALSFGNDQANAARSIADNIPTAAGTTKSDWASADSSVAIDMSKALEYIVQ